MITNGGFAARIQSLRARQFLRDRPRLSDRDSILLLVLFALVPRGARRQRTPRHIATGGAALRAKAIDVMTGARLDTATIEGRPARLTRRRDPFKTSRDLPAPAADHTTTRFLPRAALWARRRRLPPRHICAGMAALRVPRFIPTAGAGADKFKMTAGPSRAWSTLPAIPSAARHAISLRRRRRRRMTTRATVPPSSRSLRFVRDRSPFGARRSASC